MKFASTLSLLTAFFALSSFMESSTPLQAAPETAYIPRTFTNPILMGGADPWVTEHDGYYYYCGSHGGGSVWVGKSKELMEIGEDFRQVYKPAPNMPYSKEWWAPELHFFQGRWFIYVAADDGKNENHRMYVLRSKTKDAQGEYEFMGQLDTGDRWAIDGNAFEWHGKMYFVWSGWEGKENVMQSLYIAPMSNPWTINGPRVLISKPELPWELRGGNPLINEGPTALTHKGRLFIIYSASGSWSDFYCLGRLNLVGKDPLLASSWTKAPEAAFAGTSDVISPGHASFVKAKGRDWIVYHAAKHAGAGWNRNIRIQPFTWDKDGAPDFGKPVSPGVSVEY